jgi:hypothetical protein
MDEIDDRNLRGEIQKRLATVEKVAFITTMVDADAQVAAFYFLNRLNEIDVADSFNFLRAISYDCDHLAVPVHYQERYAKNASMVVAALKEVSNDLVQKLGLSPNRREWSIEDKELFSSKAFELGVLVVIPSLLNGTWDYESISQNYWEQVEKNKQSILSDGRISEYKGCLIFDASGLEGYIDPRCWILASKELMDTPEECITLTQREVYVNNEFKGISYTLGNFPLHEKVKYLDYTQKVYKALTKEEKKTKLEVDGWGGRATVGGSGWNTHSSLHPQQIIDTVLNNL